MFNVALNVRTSIAFLAGLSFALSAAPRTDRWIVILQEPPLAVQAASRDSKAIAASAAGSRIASQQRNVRSLLEKRPGVAVKGSVDTLLNAVFISAPEDAIGDIRQMPGVARVVRERLYKRHDAKAAELVRATAAWAAAGGEQNAGAGVKIGILDTGIDKNHPAFRDDSLRMPAGFPKCLPEYCDAYTSNKVIAARSFVELLAFASNPVDSRPDDYSPRDRVGHGTAVASVAAGVRVKGPAAEIQGVAPKAWLGNYKIFGSPGVNDFATNEAIIRALEAAFNDGMDVVSLSLGAPALWAPEDRDTDCGSKNVGPCDPQVDAVENAIRRGMTVVVDAGNNGDAGIFAPAMGSITTPGTAPNAITVGGTTNAHIFYSTVRPVGDVVPAALKEINAQLTTGLKPKSALTAPLMDITKLNDDGLGCQPLGVDTLKGAIALIQRGNCDFAVKLRNAQDSGAIAAIFYQREGSDFLFPISNLLETGIPSILIGNTAGKGLKDWINANPGARVTIDPALVELNFAETADEVAYFSSYGPSIGSLSIKPEIVAVGTDMYMATQSYDPNGDMFDPGGFVASQGNSFAAPQVAGAVALAKQKYPGATPGQLKSLVVNTANENVTDYDSRGQAFRARNFAVGAGKLNAGAALSSNVTAEPATLSFGIAFRNQFPTRTLKLTNLGITAATLRLEVQRRDDDPIARVNLSATSVNLAPGGSANVTVTVTGAPREGSYEGVVLVTGGATPLRVPFSYLSGNNNPANVIPLEGDGFVREPGQRVFLSFLLVDQYGVPVTGRRVTFSSTSGGGSIDVAANDTDGYGITTAIARTGNQLGYQEFTAVAGNATYVFAGRNRRTPTVVNGGVLNAASRQASGNIAAGSLITITGAGLSEARQTYSTSYLPLSLSNVSVSFDDTVRKTSYPGRLRSVSESEVTVQVPWEVDGVDSIQVKSSIGYSSQTDLLKLNVQKYSPAVFEYLDASGRLVANALDENGNPVGSENPVAAGAVLNLLVNGLGPVNSRPASGEAPANFDATTYVNPTVKIGGADAEVQFSGLAPNLPGVYLVRVAVPSGVGSGTQALELQIDGVAAKTVNTVIR